jgi:hypothetical protein
MFPLLLESVLLEFDHYLAIYTFSCFAIAISTSEGWDHTLMVQLYVFLSA